MPTARLPRDIELRDRLQQAQRAEADAVAHVYQADAALARTCGKREAIVAAADAEVQKAQSSVAEAQQQLVDVSGLDRAAQLLGLRRSDLRRPATSARPAS